MESFGSHFVELLKQLLALLVLLLVEVMHSIFYLVHRVQLQPLLVNRIDQLFQSIVKDFYRLLNLLHRHQVLEITLRIITHFF